MDSFICFLILSSLLRQNCTGVFENKLSVPEPRNRVYIVVRVPLSPANTLQAMIYEVRIFFSDLKTFVVNYVIRTRHIVDVKN